MTNHLEEQVQKLLAGMDDRNEHEVEPGIPGNETAEEIQDIYVLIVREREEEQAQVVDSTPVKHKPELMQFIPVCIFLLLIFSTLAFQLYYIFNPPIATITIIPKSQAVSLTGTLQLGRLLQPITISQSQTVPATGKGHQDAKAATGLITLYNGQFQRVFIAAGTVLTGASGVQIVTDQDASIPAGNPPSYGQVTVSAHALVFGTRGNIPAYDIDQACCDVSVLAKNTPAFTGGQDERDFHTVTQSDIDTTATTLNPTLVQSMQGALQGQLNNGEQLTALPCIPTVTADHQPGQEAREVKITVTETCSAVAYNKDALQAQETALLTTLATKQVGPGYTLVGAIHVTLPLAIVAHTTTLVFTCHGVWVYGVTNAQQQLIKSLIAGKTTQQALHTLALLPGIVKAAIGDRDDNATLPRNPALIHLIILV